MERVALVLGESLVDVVTTVDGVVEHAGGSAANAAVALARLGRPVRFATAIGDDAHGALLRDHLAADGVRLAGNPVVLPRTATAQATLDAAGGATYVFDIAWRLGPLDLGGDEPLVAMCGSIGTVLAPGADQVRDLVADLREHATVTYDVNARPALTGTDADVLAAVADTAALADVVKASDEDLAALWPGLTLDEAARHVLSMGPLAVVVTCGRDGARWVTRGGTGRVPAPRVEVTDTIGAGDTFGAALVDALWERDLLGADRRDALGSLDGRTWDEVLDWAARAAAVTVSRPGADPPRRAELERGAATPGRDR
jgi:fructokinase